MFCLPRPGRRASLAPVKDAAYDLVILAAGLGSRFGGLKQVAPVGPGGELIVEYSAHDARRAGFGRVVFVIRRDLERDFRAAIGRRLEGRMDVAYAFQELADVPPPHAPPAGRTKPWGTGHAVLAAAAAVRGPFAVINADDFYGAAAYRALAAHFRGADPAGPGAVRPEYALVGYPLRQTLSEHGSVNRGLCRVDAAGRLTGLDEVLKIERTPDGRARHPLPGGGWQPLNGDEIVSMTCFGFGPALFGQLRELFAAFLDRQGRSETAEFYLPVAVNDLMAAGRAAVRVLHADGRWFGVTHREDLPAVRAAVAELIAGGEYPDRL
jgi:MobA-like NTP transferase domain